MQNNYVKELATKSFQEEMSREYKASKKQSFHLSSFVAGLFSAVLLISMF